jgi:predicted N-acyltransferase
VSAQVELLRIAQGVEQLPETQWQELVRGRPALRLEVLRAITGNATRALPLRIFLLEDQHGLAAAAICEPIASDSKHNPLDVLLFGRAVGAARRLGASTQPALVFQAPLMRQSPIVVRAADAAVQQRLIETLLDRIEDHAAEQKLAIAFVGVSPEDKPQWKALRRRRYLASEFESTARLEIQWSDFEGYVGHLRHRSKNAAQSARKERNRNRRSTVEIRQVPRSEEAAQALSMITREHYRHKNSRDPLWGPQFLPQLWRALGEDMLVFEATRHGDRLAMLAVIRSGSVAWMAFIGIEQRDRLNDFTYANMVFYYPADWAPPLGLKSLLYGTAVQKAKAKRGCRLIACHLFYRPYSSTLRMLARPYLGMHQAWYRRKAR